MTDLEPNGPRERWAHVYKTYQGTQNERILPLLGGVVLSLVGQDDDARAFFDDFGENTFTFGFTPLGPTYQASWDQLLGEARYKLERLLPEEHPLDFAIPWAARELARSFKAARRYEARPEHHTDDTEALIEYGNTYDNLVQRLPAIAMWARQERIDLNRTSLAEALEAIEDYEFDVDVPPGLVVYEFDDGWTIQRIGHDRLADPMAQLAGEGHAMQNCIGAGYLKDTLAHETAIFSLRDPAGKPHVSMEWRPDHNIPHGAAAVRAWGVTPRGAQDGRFIQVRGKQNRAPKRKYVPYVHEFIEQRFGRDPLGMLMAAAGTRQDARGYLDPTPGFVSFSGQTLDSVDFFDLEGDELWLADFKDAHLVNCTFPDIEDMDFSGATLERCHFDQILITDCEFLDTKFNRTVISRTALLRCRFDGATFLGFEPGQPPLARTRPLRSTKKRIDELEHIRTCHFKRCSFPGALFQQAALDEVVFEDGSFDGAVFDGCSLSGVGFQNVGMNDVRFVATEGRGVSLDSLDLRNMAPEQIDTLLGMVTFHGRAERTEETDRKDQKKHVRAVLFPEGVEPLGQTKVAVARRR